MNGEEKALLQRGGDSPLAENRPISLNAAQKQDMVLFASSPMFKTVCQVMENEIIGLREEAEEIDPKDQQAQLAGLTVVYAIKKFYKKFRGSVDFERTEAFADTRSRIAAAALEDRDFVENIVLNQATNC
jgi:hypothetical protein